MRKSSTVSTNRFPYAPAVFAGAFSFLHPYQEFTVVKEKIQALLVAIATRFPGLLTGKDTNGRLLVQVARPLGGQGGFLFQDLHNLLVHHGVSARFYEFSFAIRISGFRFTQVDPGLRNS